MKDKKITIAVIAFALVLVLTLVSTYAFFTATATGNENKTVNVKTAELGVSYTHGTGVNLENLALVEDYSSYIPFSVTNTGSVAQTFNVLWDTVTTNSIVGLANLSTNESCNNASDSNCDDVREDFVVQLYELPTAFDTANPTTSIASGQMVSESHLYGVTSNSIITPNLNIATDATKNYVLKVSFDYSDKNQDYQQGKQFIGKIKVDNVELYTPLVTTGLASDWQVSTTTNTSGGYTLEAFTGSLDNSPSVRVVDGKNITEIANTLFLVIENEEITDLSYIGIKEIIIPEGIVTIQDANLEPFTSAFMGCLNLDKINLPSTLVTIGTAAFYYTGLYELRIPSSVQTIGDGAFSYDGPSSSLNLIIPNNSSLIYIGSNVFSRKNIPGTITIPSGVVTIGSSAFGYNKITNIVFAGNNITTIDDYAFKNNYLTGVIDLPSSITSLGEDVFANTGNGHNNITAINFAGKTNLTGITLPEYWDRKDTSLSNNYIHIPHTCSGIACTN